jgi:hypothetical protein
MPGTKGKVVWKYSAYLPERIATSTGLTDAERERRHDEV